MYILSSLLRLLTGQTDGIPTVIPARTVELGIGIGDEATDVASFGSRPEDASTRV